MKKTNKNKKIRTKPLLFKLVTVVMVLAVFPRELVAESGMNIYSFTPVLNGLAGSYSALYEKPGEISLGLFTEYSSNPMTIASSTSEEYDHYITTEALNSFLKVDVGLFEGLSLGVSVPLQVSSDTQVDSLSEEQTEPKLMDIDTSIKLNIMNRRSFKLSLQEKMTLPTGDINYLTSDGQSTFSTSILLTAKWKKMRTNINLGYKYRPEAMYFDYENAPSIYLQNQYIAALGVGVLLSKKIEIEAGIRAHLSDQTDEKYNYSNPKEWSVQLKTRLFKRLDASFGGSSGIGYGYGVSDYKVTAGLSWSYKKKRKKRRVQLAKQKLKKWYEEKDPDF